ncbi:MAG TPA: hypothetical protein VGB52_03785 [Actinomycetota bacterium]
MFDLDTLIVECQEALREPDARRAVREILVRTVEEPSSVAEALGGGAGGIEVLHNTPELTLLNVIWAPGMALPPHDHRMWATIGIYGGVEDNTLYRRGPDRIQSSGGRELRESDVLALGSDAIHSVSNPERRFTGAIHIYGGDFVNQPRSQWDPDTLLEQPYDLAYVRGLFEEANARWAAEVDADLDDHVS